MTAPHAPPPLPDTLELAPANAGSQEHEAAVAYQIYIELGDEEASALATVGEGGWVTLLQEEIVAFVRRVVPEDLVRTRLAVELGAEGTEGLRRLKLLVGTLRLAERLDRTAETLERFRSALQGEMSCTGAAA